MVILLKALCFALWMLIMLAMIVGSRHKAASAYRNVKVYIEDEDDSKMATKRAWAKK
ncbi:MAG: hypothetical protein PHR04_03945 [Syntrophomonadaceae bacterium]|nr:hypothetical protein [Syntrophomonadaceae bacterium]